MKGKGGIYMAILVVFSFVYNINKFFEVTTGYVTTEQNVTVATVKVRHSGGFRINKRAMAL